MSVKTGGEPLWVVVAIMNDPNSVNDRQYASTTVDAPNPDDAEPQAQRVIVGYEGREPDRIARVTGPFPNYIPTGQRERRPNVCAGCGLNCYCGNHPPTPSQTWWKKLDIENDENDTPWECINCGTITWLNV